MQNFSARETEWMLELDGIELAGFSRRALAFVLDWIFIVIVFSVIAILSTGGYFALQHLEGKPTGLQQLIQESHDGKQHVYTFGGEETLNKLDHKQNCGVSDEHEIRDEAIQLLSDLVVPVLYFGILLWKGKGRTPGKRIMKIRVVSIVHRHLTFWHCVERALGYGAAALELGFGFVQYFIHPYRRCAQDRLAETIVITEAGYLSMQHKFEHPLIPDTGE